MLANLARQTALKLITENPGIADRDIAAVIFGPGSLTVAHTANEWIDVQELVEGARIYARIFADVLGA